MKPRIEKIVTPKEVLAINKARKEVIRAARDWKMSLTMPFVKMMPGDAAFHLIKMIDKLDKLEFK